MARKIITILFTVHLLAVTATVDYLVPGGQIIGLALQDNTVTVADFDGDLGLEAKASGLKIGDDIQFIDGQRPHHQCRRRYSAGTAPFRRRCGLDRVPPRKRTHHPPVPVHHV